MTDARVIRAIDLCCGAGGWAVAARGLPIWITHAFDCWDRACETYALNHPETEVIQCDLREGLPVDLPGAVDLVLGGIPCQWISPARGKNRADPEEIEREQALLDAVLGITRGLNPRWWCLEDVVQLRKHLPPLTPYRVVDAQEFGYTCQGRRRVFVGVFPPPAIRKRIPTLSDYLQPGPHEVRHSSRTAELVHMSARGTVSPSKVRVCVSPCHERVPTVLGSGVRHGNAAPVILDPSIPGGRRELSWREAARLQGFPADFVFVGSRTDVWRMLANAVQIDLARGILEAIVQQWRE